MCVFSPFCAFFAGPSDKLEVATYESWIKILFLRSREKSGVAEILKPAKKEKSKKT